MNFEEYQDYINEIFKGILTGILTIYLIIYGLRPSIAYPDIILDFFENKWIILIIAVIIYYVIIWDYRTGILLLLSTIALLFDYIIFAKVENDTDSKNNDYKYNNQFPVFI